jgi:predicted Zn-dependent peptidase
MPGVWLRAIHTDKFKSSYLGLTMLTPLERETAAANALIPAVLRRGTASHPDLEALSAALDELYGGAIEPVVRKKGETQCIGFVASFLDDAYTLEGDPILEPAAALLGELLLSPRTEGEGFLPDYVHQEQNNLIDRIRAQVNDKRRYASARLCQLMCREEAFGVDKLGDEAHAAAVTPEGLWSRYQQLLRTAEIEVYYCGSAQPERAARALTAALSGLPRDGERLDPECEVRLHAGPEPQLVEEHMDVSQGKLALGFRTGGITCWEEEYPALVMCNAIFGGTPLSKLFLNVREKLSLCYYASSMLEKMKGLVLVSSGIEFDKYQQAKDEILAQLEAIRRGEIEDWELEGARRALISGHLSTLDDQGQLEEFWLGQAAAGLDTGLEALVERFASVTREHVAAAAQRLELDTVYFLNGQED